MTTLVQGQGPASLYEYSGTALIVFTAVFVPLQIVFVALRLWARSIVKVDFAVDSILCLASLISQMALAGLAIGSVYHAGVGYHISVLSVDTQMTFGKYLFAISFTYIVTINLPKYAIIYLYLRLFPQKSVRYVAIVLACIMIGQNISGPIALLTICRPFAANWDPLLLLPPTNGHCANKEALFVWMSLPSIVTDVALLILPIPIILGLKLNKRTKVGVLSTFLVASLGLVTSCIRFAEFLSKNSFIDGTWAAVNLIICTQAEVGVYLISACLLTLKPLLERFLKSSLITRMTGSSYGSSGLVKTGSRHRYGFGQRSDTGDLSGNADTYHLQGIKGATFHRLNDSSLGASGEDDKIMVSNDITITTETKYLNYTARELGPGQHDF